MGALPDTYRSFIEAKVALAPASRFEISPVELNPAYFLDGCKYVDAVASEAAA